MKGRWLINLGLLIALAASVMVMRNEIEQERFVPVLTDLVPQDVYEIRIARKGEPTIILSQEMAGWRMQEPLQIDADQGQVDKLLGILSTPVLRSFPEEAAAVEELGLAPAKLELRVDSETLEVGDIDPLGQSRYVASGGLVHLISDRYFPLLISPPIDYVSPKLLPRDFDPVFGTIGGVPLTADSLGALDEATAERVEALAEDLSGSIAELERDDGARLQFVVSEDRRRWARTDQRLLYVLTTAPELVTDPDAVDPAGHVPGAIPQTLPRAQEDARTSDDATATRLDLGGPIQEGMPANLDAPVPAEKAPDGDLSEPYALGTGSDTAETPPVVKLTPDGREIPMSPEAPTQAPSPPASDGANPYGFGVDPFAPDPPVGGAQGPEGSH